MHDDLDLPEHTAFQSWFWKVQRVGWGFLSVLVLAGLLGLSGGSGPLNHQTIKTMAGAKVLGPIVLREGTPESLTFEIPGAGSMSISFDEQFLEAFDVHERVPDPIRSLYTDEGMTLQFAASPARPTVFRLSIIPRSAGHSTSILRLGEEQVVLRFLIMP